MITNSKGKFTRSISHIEIELGAKHSLMHATEKDLLDEIKPGDPFYDLEIAAKNKSEITNKTNEAFKSLTHQFAEKILQMPEAEREKHQDALNTLQKFSDYKIYPIGSGEGYYQLNDSDRIEFLKAIVEGKDELKIKKSSPPQWKEIETTYNLKDIRETLDLDHNPELKKQIEESLKVLDEKNQTLPSKSKATKTAEDLLKSDAGTPSTNQNQTQASNTQENGGLFAGLINAIENLVHSLEDGSLFGTHKQQDNNQVGAATTAYAPKSAESSKEQTIS